MGDKIIRGEKIKRRNDNLRCFPKGRKKDR